VPADLDAGEVILAVNGCEDLIAKRPLVITQRELFEIDTFSATVYKLCGQLVRGTLDRPYQRYAVKSYRKLLDSLSEPPDAAYLQGIINRFPPQAYAQLAAFMVTAARAWKFLAESYPKTVKQELLGVRNLDVGSQRLGEWESIYTVVDDPLHLFDLVRTARLQRRQVEAVQLVYPKLFIGITQALYEAMVAQKAKRPKWEPPFAQGVSTLLGVPGIPVDMAAALAQAQAETRGLNEQREAQQQAARTAAVRTAPKSQRQEITEAKEAQL
jgi:hypothetical protein